ncbi:hypothetical protein DVH24_009334 [Malus domestica]|uniref:Uncharacterized protein n=1 Tax=Malus domestica TaxID=3750 RepID=A0A498IVU0_MALDO|nr:hypothetical protein DVH24_009334 [Malus domestica]
MGVLSNFRASIRNPISYTFLCFPNHIHVRECEIENKIRIEASRIHLWGVFTIYVISKRGLFYSKDPEVCNNHIIILLIMHSTAFLCVYCCVKLRYQVGL